MVYARTGHEVKTVAVAGPVRVQDGELLVADEADVRIEAQVRAEGVAQRATADPVHKDMTLLEPWE